MLPFDAAQAAVIAACRPRAAESVALIEAAGRVAARDVIALEDLVPFARSAMDGFAVRAADINGSAHRLPIAGAAYAAPGEARLAPGTAMAIATGAALPFGADTVIPIEHVEVVDGSIAVSRPVVVGAAIFPPGDDARRGDLLVSAGTLLGPASLGLLAAAGSADVEVYRKPRVAIVCGGDELVGAGETPGYGQVRNSNGVMLAAAVAAAGGFAQPPIFARDDRAAVRDALRGAFREADLVVTSGGASVGERDFVKAVCDELGVRFAFRMVALRPAKPTAFGSFGESVIAVLPGNPAAAFVAFMELVRPAIRALGGQRELRLPRVTATLAGTIRAKPERHFAAFAALSTGPAGLVATPLENQCSSLTRTAADAAGFIVVPPGQRTHAPGDRVDVDVFEWAKLTPPSGSPETRARDAFALSG
jgi:molybdopterin molybdotransferase